MNPHEHGYRPSKPDFSFLEKIYHLNGVMRFNGPENNQMSPHFTESVPEHTWVMGMMFLDMMAACPNLTSLTNVGDALAIIQVHDIGETLMNGHDWTVGDQMNGRVNHEVKFRTELTTLFNMLSNEHQALKNQMLTYYFRYTQCLYTLDLDALLAKYCDGIQGNFTAGMFTRKRTQANNCISRYVHNRKVIPAAQRIIACLTASENENAHEATGEFISCHTQRLGA